jgi:hypothetical protein
MVIDINKRKYINIKDIKKSVCKTLSENKLGNIKLIKRIGSKSADGEVYKACYPLSCKNVLAVKRLQIELPNKKDQEYAKNFLNSEAVNSKNLIWAELTFLTIATELVQNKICPNLPMYFRSDYCNDCNITGTSAPCMFISNEFADGGDLKSYIKGGEFTADEMISCYYQVFFGLYALKYHFNIEHNDLHWMNVLIHNLKPKKDDKLRVWRYKFNDGSYIDVPIYNKLFVIWDFGRSTIKNKIEPPNWRTEESSGKANDGNLFNDYKRISEMIEANPCSGSSSTSKTRSKICDKKIQNVEDEIYGMLKGIVLISEKEYSLRLILDLLPKIEMKVKPEKIFYIEKKYKSKHPFINSLMIKR